MDTKFLKLIYDSREVSPASWLLCAHSLRAAARRLDWLEKPPTEDEPLSFVGEYRMLMGLSFENLLKGIIVAHRVRAGKTESLTGIFHHKLFQLAEEIDGDKFKLSADDLTILSNLTVYVEWLGRYPIPKKAEELLLARSHSSSEHGREIALWNRMFAYLKQFAWMPKGTPGNDGWSCLFTK